MLDRVSSMVALALVLVAASACPALADADDAASLRVEIVPTRLDGKQVLRVGRGRSFQVRLTNVGKRTLRLWEERFSWGYYALSFEVAADAGPATRLVKKPVIWTRNMPLSFSLAPGKVRVIVVSLDRETWLLPNGLPRATNGGASLALRMRAVFSIAPDAESRKQHVWTGEASSSFEDYVVSAGDANDAWP